MTSAQRPSRGPGHVCWTYRDPARFEARAREWLLAGLAAGERVRYVGDTPAPEVLSRWREDPRWRDALDGGAAQVVAVGDAYAGLTVGPEEAVAVYQALTRSALDDGFTGLRVVADGTTLVGSPARLRAFARYEHLVDRFMRTAPMTAACGYDRRRLDDRTIEELASLHRAADPGATMFHLHAADDADADLVLAGELDTSNQDLFANALRHVDVASSVDADHADYGPAAELVIGAHDLRFVDHRSLVHLQRHAERRGTTVVLRTGLAPAARLVRMLGLSRVRVEAGR
ncbi:MEDS domain-containing protein [Micromonospora sp. NPDC000089]|uniref:MEDS domain-containing protein n=1 Tax=unclassified Micromonospora TaxID=2617518 RepID=UPI003685589F